MHLKSMWFLNKIMDKTKFDLLIGRLWNLATTLALLIFPVFVICSFPWGSYGWLHPDTFPYEWIARGVMGAIDVSVAVLIMVVTDLIAIFLFAGNKSISNFILGFFIFIISGIAFALYCYYTMEISANLICYVLTALFLLFKDCSFKYDRCPDCHSLEEMISSEFSRPDKRHLYPQSDRLRRMIYRCPICGHEFIGYSGHQSSYINDVIL